MTGAIAGIITGATPPSSAGMPAHSRAPRRRQPVQTVKAPSATLASALLYGRDSLRRTLAEIAAWHGIRLQAMLAHDGSRQAARQVAMWQIHTARRLRIAAIARLLRCSGTAVHKAVMEMEALAGLPVGRDCPPLDYRNPDDRRSA